MVDAAAVRGRYVAPATQGDSMKVLLIILCFFLPFLAVLIKKGPCIEVLWAFLLQLLGHIPGVIYGIVKVTQD
jgi:uncharacterized membrane protein YqaE (UPF0057 family)